MIAPLISAHCFKIIRMKKFFKKISQQPIRSTYFFIIVAIIATNLLMHQWNRGERIINIDVKGYYAYLPATFIYHDLDFNFLDDPNNPYADFQKSQIWYNLTDEGKPVINYTNGLAVCYAPFFFIAHLGCKVFGIPANGYTMPYDFMLQFGAILYFIMGLWFLRRILELFFSEKTTSITLLAVVLGTNLLYYGSKEAAMSHVFSFAFIALFIWLLIKWFNRQSWSNTIQLGLVTGMVILIRPINIIVIVCFGLYNVTRLTDIGERFRFLFKNYRQMLIMIMFAFIVWIPQMLYWHAVTGHIFYYSYSSNTGFFWNDPEVVNLLFSYRKGWLVYTPLMLFSLLGLIPLYRKNRALFWPCLVISISVIYIFSCWCYWWFGGGFGSRAFIDFYALFAIPFAAFTDWILKIKWKWIHRTWYFTVTVLIFFNLFQTLQYYRGVIHYVSMTKDAYWSVFMKMKRPKNYNSLLEYPDYEGVKARLLERKNPDKESR